MKKSGIEKFLNGYNLKVMQKKMVVFTHEFTFTHT